MTFAQTKMITKQTKNIPFHHAVTGHGMLDCIQVLLSFSDKEYLGDRSGWMGYITVMDQTDAHCPMKTTYLQYIEYIFYEPREEEKIPDFGDTSDSLDGDLFLKKSFIQATFGLKI